MLDLKAKLLAAGLVTEAQVEKVEREEEDRRQKRRQEREAREARARDAQAGKGAGARGPGGPRGGGPRAERGEGGRGDRRRGTSPARRGPSADDHAERLDQERWRRRLEQLRAAGKSDQYEAIRSWVQRTRIDAVKAIPSEAAERFHFARHDEGIASLVLEPDIKAQVLEGAAAISAYMSNNGLAHCVVPREVALDIAALRPEWVRVLEGFEVVPSQDARLAAAPGETSAGETSAVEGSAVEGSAVEGSAGESTGPDTAAADDAGEATLATPSIEVAAADAVDTGAAADSEGLAASADARA